MAINIPVVKQVLDHFVGVVAALSVPVYDDNDALIHTLTLAATDQVQITWSMPWDSQYDHRVVIRPNSEHPEHHTRYDMKNKIGFIVEIQCKPSSSASIDSIYLAAYIQDAIYTNKRLTNVIDTTEVDDVEYAEAIDDESVHFVVEIFCTSIVHHQNNAHKGS
jgi:hypothetical protein